jgi:hypothetical protein
MVRADDKARWPFRRPWLNVGVVVALVVIFVHVSGIVAESWVKPRSAGQQNITTAEVESGVRRAAMSRGAVVSAVSCSESVRNEWHCMIRLTGGGTTGGRAVWRESEHSLGIEVNYTPRQP